MRFLLVVKAIVLHSKSYQITS